MEKQSKTALVLAGGGLSGLVYELGALRAINDLLVGRSASDFDIYVGTSAGAIAASGLVNGLTPQSMLQSMEGIHPTLRPIQRQHLFRLNVGGMIDRAWKLPSTFSGVIRHYWQNPTDLNLIDLLWEMADTLPAALYDSTALEVYMRNLLTGPGMGNYFTDLDRELYVIATSLENGKRVVFGDPDHLNVPISQAVAASSAVPLVYNPVRVGDDEFIDGGMRGNASLDVAIENGAKLIVCINPLVPFDHAKNKPDDAQFLSDQGMQVVVDQVMRIVLHSGLHYHIKQLRRQHPDVDIILLEPRRSDVVMMSANIMRYSTRLAIAQHGYESVTVDLARDYEYFKTVLARHNIKIHRDTVVPQLEKLREGDQIEEVLDVKREAFGAQRLERIRERFGDLESLVKLGA